MRPFDPWHAFRTAGLRRSGALALALGGLLACSGEELGGVCDPSYGPAVRATIQDSVTTEPRAFGAQLKLVDGTWADSITGLNPGASVLVAGYRFRTNDEQEWPGRPGNYTVTVSAPGYQVWQRNGVRVDGSSCGAITVSLLVKLKPGS